MSVVLAEVSAATQELTPHTRDIRSTTLPNGLLVITERMPHLRSVSMGVWLRSGSRDETPETNGISHFLEHMVFKGTTSRSAQQFAREVDYFWGNIEFYTSKENICFSIKVLDSNVPLALDLLSDLVLRPTLTAEDIAREQGVILEEIKMDEDNPDYLVHELFTQKFWQGDALGRPILGTAKTVPSFSQPIVLAEYARRFTPGNMLFTAAGNFEHDAFLAEVEQAFHSLAETPGTPLPRTGAPSIHPHVTLRNKASLEQVQFCLALPGLPTADPDRYILFLMNSVLGGGMSSRLFQSVREERGLAYSIYSETSPFRDTGSLAVYAGCAVENTREVLDLTLAEFTRLKEQPVSEEELRRVKEQLKTNMVLGLESSGARINPLARQQMFYGRFFTTDEITAEVDRVTAADITRLSQRLLQPSGLTLTLLGNLGSLQIDRSDLVC